MPSYVTLLNYTSKGISEIKTSPERITAARAGAEALVGALGYVSTETMRSFDEDSFKEITGKM
jgi:uncharacterized protein with GYD domain